MVISASRRTDIPCYYGEWFANRIKEGFLYVRNPMNPHQVSRINLSPDQVDCIVFWTKNPANIMEYLEAFQDYMYYFQFTLTGYGRDVEPNLPDKKKELIPAFQALSERIGKERVIWRYDPILVNGRYTMEYHLKAFEKIAASLAGYTEKAVISFVDFYGKTQRNMRKLAIRDITKDEMASLASGLARIASRYHLAMETCAEEIDLQSQGIRHGSCIKPIEAVGKEFDPNLHNAVMQTESEEYESGIIAQELQKGYMYRDSVVRHSMVAVVS